MKWIDSLDIALDLIEQYPDTDPENIRFTDLREWVMGLENFNDQPEHCGERILEAIQMCWIEEMD